ncbi:hypothetical protein QP166_14610 [Sphingomonas sp. LR60]|uniref:hypothetical protein n=1 Tax=Sphingomonas sp. LR60 TaxID=3050233 RepID=UPI002FDF8A01
MSPIERAARALCRLAGRPENTRFEGRPMWESYIDEAAASLSAVRHAHFVALTERLLAWSETGERGRDWREMAELKQEAHKLLLRMQAPPHDR